MRKVVFFIFTIAALIVATGTTALASSTIDIDHTSANEGYVSVKFNTGSDKKIKLLVSNGSDKYYYNLHNSEAYENFPLQMGNGNYTVSIYENTTGNKYRKLTSKSFNVIMQNPNSVYLNSVQEISFEETDATVQLADALVAQATEDKRLATGNEGAVLTDREVIDLYYNYVVKNISYDYDKINYLNYDYVPDNDATLSVGTGICYDFSSLLAAMLRSQDIPAKLVKGYASWTDVYHAWNEVYIASEGRWVIVDTTYDSYNYLRNYAYAFEKSADVYAKSKEF